MSRPDAAPLSPAPDAAAPDADRRSDDRLAARAIIDVIVENDASAELWPAASAPTAASWVGWTDRAARAALVEAGAPAAGPGVGIDVLLCGDRRIAELNGRFRGAPAATNVLAWPAIERAAPMAAADWPQAPARDPSEIAAPQTHLGDLALAWETTRREAEEGGRPLEAHVAHLIVHGVLHLCGYGHDDDAAAEQMEAAEKRALARIDLSI